MLKVERGWVQVENGPAQIGPPKTDAGRRSVNIPANLMPVLFDHLNRYTAPEPDAWLFPGENGNPVSPRTLSRAWTTARQSVGCPDLRLHDLRHTGLTWVARLGATTREIMRRGGHSSPVAALPYQHATDDSDAVLADALGALSTGDVVRLRRTKDGRSSEVSSDSSQETGAEQAQPEQPQRYAAPTGFEPVSPP
jgi:integrase